MIDILPPDGLDFTAGQAHAAGVVNEAIEKASGMTLAGYAGTGKSTLTASIVRGLRKSQRPFHVCAPTGKAAARLREMGVPATTLHRWLYVPIEDKHGNVSFRVRSDMDTPDDFTLIVDEASMITPAMHEDILHAFEWYYGTFENGRSLLYVGDGFQLPPILSDAERAAHPGFSVVDAASKWAREHSFAALTEVTRQAATSPILMLATALRNGMQPPKPDGDVVTIKRAGIDAFLPVAVETVTRHGVCITWRNRDRCLINQYVRSAFGYEQPIVPGDDLINLVNMNAGWLAVSNGDTMSVVAVKNEQRFKAYDNTEERATLLTAELPTGEVGDVWLLHRALGVEKPTGLHKARAVAQDRIDNAPVIVADYAYCLTAHKSQGSEYGEVAVYAPDGIVFVLDQTEAVRWLYTATTRAQRRLAVYAGPRVSGLCGW